MFPQSQGRINWCISLFSQVTCELIVSENSSLIQSIDALMDLHLCPAIVRSFIQVILYPNFHWNNVQAHSRVFITFHCGVEFKNFNICHQSFCTWCGQDAVNDKFCFREVTASGSQENSTLLICLVLNNPQNIIHFSYGILVQLIQLWLV